MRIPVLEKLVAITLIVACLCVFGGSATSEFINFDDGPYILSNPHVQSGLTFEGLVWAFKATHAANWHPLTWLSHMLDCQLYGLNPAGHHMTSLFLHIANTLLLLVLLQNGTGRFWESAAVAALFALHPLRVESVVWVSERKDVLSGFFAMLTILAYVHYARQRSPSGYTLTLLFFALGLMAKPMLVTLPFILLLLDFWPLQRCAILGIPGHRPEATFFWSSENPKYRVGGLVLEKVPFFVLSAASSLVTFLVQYKGGAVSTFEVVPIKIRVCNALVSYWAYLGKIFWPSNLAVFYPHPREQLPFWEGLVAALFLIAVSFMVISQARRRPFLITGWFWFLVMLVPVIGIIQVGAQSMADRYTYLPSIGVYIIVAWTLQSLPCKVFNHKILLAAGLSVTLIFLSIISWVQTGYWRNTKTLFHRTAFVTSGNYLAHTLLGDALTVENRLELAQTEYEEALSIWPQFVEAHNGLGKVLAKRGLHDEAMNHFQTALRERPNCASTHIHIASELAERGNLEGAVSHYSEALLINPDSVDAHSGLGATMARMQKMPEAASHLNKAVELCPNCPEPHNNLGRLLTLQGNIAEAASQLQRAIELSPAFAEAYNNMGLLYLNIGALEEASYYFSAALHFKADYAKARLNLIKVASLIVQSNGVDE